MTLPTIKGKKATYSNSFLKLRKREYVTELILVKSYEKGLVFHVLKAHHKSFAKVSKGASTLANPSMFYNTSEYSGVIKARKKIACSINR